MVITYSEAPSFSQGWCVSVDTTRKVILFKLVDGSYRLADHFVAFAKAYAATDLQPEDDVFLAQILDKIHLKINQNESWTLDGTCHGLSIVCGSQKTGFEWNASLPKGFRVEALIEKLSSLAEICKNKRDGPDGRAGYNP